MVRVLHVLDVELPVVRQHLHEAPEHLDGLVHHAQEAPVDLRAEIVVERRRPVGQAREDEATERGGAELSRPVLGLAEGLGHAAQATDALLEGDAEEVAPQVVAPRVIDALEVLGVAPIVEGDQRSAVRAPVLEGVDLAVLAADHDDRHLAHERGPVVARPLDVHLEAHVVPGRPLEDAAQLGLVVGLVLVDPEGDPGQRAAGPRVLRVGSRHIRLRSPRRIRPRSALSSLRRDAPTDGTARSRSAACCAAGP